jgi:hypothetical protein
VSSTREAWEKPAASYVFEFEADEVKALLPPTPEPQPEPPPAPKPPPKKKVKRAPEKAKAARVREGEAVRSDAASAKAADREQVTRAGSV